VGGRLTVAAMNTLNFFVTADIVPNAPSGQPPAPGDNVCGGNANLECRGWDSDQPLELDRQRDKLLQALIGIDADVLGLNELENGPADALTHPDGIIAGLDELLGEDVYEAIETGIIGTDAIRVGLIYKPATVTPVGDFKFLTSAVDSRFNDARSRPALAQTFEENATGERFTVVVNHLKSKGSACVTPGVDVPLDPDLGDGQGNCSQTRRAAAEALVDWLATDPTGSGDRRAPTMSTAPPTTGRTSSSTSAARTPTRTRSTARRATSTTRWPTRRCSGR
jgi:predicted extracellular nuclease